MDQTPLDATLVPADHISRVAQCRRIAARFAQAEGLPETSSSNAAIVASELATNLVKYGQRGVMHLAPMSDRGRAGVEILAIDSGPGISNVAESLRDGHSTGSTSGTGLGAVRRLSHRFDIYSRPGQGTVIVSQIFMLQDPASAPAFSLGLTMRPLAGETDCGDSWAVRFGQDWILLLVADGLGHGLLAAEASRAAAAAFCRSREELPVELVQVMHAALRGTRGAALAVARIEMAAGRVRFAGLGNISGKIASPLKTYEAVSQNGTAGHEVRHVREFTYPWTDDSLMIMHSDGLSANWNLASYPGLLQCHESLISGVLYRDLGRDRDDACIIVGRKR